MQETSILIYMHPPFYKANEKIYFDLQAQNGLRLWTENFPIVRVMAPLVDLGDREPPSDAQDLQPFLNKYPLVETIMLPRRGTLGFLKDVSIGYKTIKEKIVVSQYLVFGFSGFIGDWGTVACIAALRMRRPYAVFKDSVGHRVTRIFERSEGRSKLSRELRCAIMKYSDRFVVRRAKLSLLHGHDTFDYYGPISLNPQLIHDIHITKSDRIEQAQLNDRLNARQEHFLRIIYVGRVEAIKGPDHWVSAISNAANSGAKLSAKWYGSGSLLDRERENVLGLGQENLISFAGWMTHQEVLLRLRKADIFVFTHMTEESPRCIIEALSAGLPLVGYKGSYVTDIIGNSNAGLLVERGDVEGLTVAIQELSRDLERLKDMSIEARRISEPFNDEDVFRARSDIIKTHL